MSDSETPGVTVWRCLQCGTEAFPLRLRCAACGSPRGTEATVLGGRLSDHTVVRRAIGGTLPEPTHIGTVDADGGAVLIARLADDLADGDRVALTTERGAPVARRE